MTQWKILFESELPDFRCEGISSRQSDAALYVKQQMICDFWVCVRRFLLASENFKASGSCVRHLAR